MEMIELQPGLLFVFGFIVGGMGFIFGFTTAIWVDYKYGKVIERMDDEIDKNKETKI